MCCGQKMMRPSGVFRPGTDLQRLAMPPARMTAGPAVFEHVRVGTLVVQGPASGKQYRFAGPGATAVIDPRDLASLRGVPHLRERRR